MRLTETCLKLYKECTFYPLYFLFIFYDKVGAERDMKIITNLVTWYKKTTEKTKLRNFVVCGCKCLLMKSEAKIPWDSAKSN